MIKLSTWQTIAILVGGMMLIILLLNLGHANDLPKFPQGKTWYLVQITKFQNMTRVQFLGQFENQAQCVAQLSKMNLPRTDCKTVEQLNELGTDQKPGQDI